MPPRLCCVCINRLFDARALLRVDAASKDGQPLNKELSVGRVVRELERIESGGHARSKNVIAPANRANEKLRATILIEKDNSRGKLPCLSKKKVDHHCLPGAGRPDNSKIAQIALMKIEEIWASSCC